MVTEKRFLKPCNVFVQPCVELATCLSNVDGRAINASESIEKSLFSLTDTGSLGRVEICTSEWYYTRRAIAYEVSTIEIHRKECDRIW